MGKHFARMLYDHVVTHLEGFCEHVLLSPTPDAAGS